MSKAEEQIESTYAETGSIRQSAAWAGVSFGKAKRHLRKVGMLPKPGEPTPAAASPLSAGGTESESTITVASDKLIRTLDEAVAFAEVDTSVWRVKSWECTAWQVGMKVRTFKAGKVVSEEPTTRPLWRVSLRLERILPAPVRDAIEGLVARLGRGAPEIPAPKLSKGCHLCTVDLVDVHFGKLAWAAETGQSYDLRIAETLYKRAVSEIVQRASAYPISQFVLPIGSDFLHVDNLSNTTTAGTPQDVDGRLAKILEVALASVVWAVELMASNAAVHAYWVPGNHDRALSMCLAMMLRERFHRTPHVKVDCSPAPRKYHRFGKVLIGMTHGDGEKPTSLPIIMATERPADWAECVVKEWHIGHLHRSRRHDFMALDTHNGIPVRTINSLSGIDAWHFRQGYVGTTRAAEAYIYGAAELVGWFNAPVRTQP